MAVEKEHVINNESISTSTTVEINETGLNMKTAQLQTSSTGNNTEDTVAGGTNKEVYSPILNINATPFMLKFTSILPR